MCRCVEEGNGKMKPYLLRSLCRRLSRACMNAPESRVELVAEHVDGLVSSPRIEEESEYLDMPR
jgi:hypothetical protein